MNKWLELMLYQAREAYSTTTSSYEKCPFCQASSEIVKLGGETYYFDSPCSRCYFSCSSLPKRVRSESFYTRIYNCVGVGKEILRRLEEALW